MDLQILVDEVSRVGVVGVNAADTRSSKKNCIRLGAIDPIFGRVLLRQIKFPADGALSLEYGGNPMNPIDDMKACLEIAREAIAKSA